MARPARPLGRGRFPLAVKLWIGVVVANLGGLGFAVYVAGAVRSQTVSPDAEGWLIAAYYVSMLVVAAVDALWLDEVLFKGAFRITHIQGQAEALRRRGIRRRADEAPPSEPGPQTAEGEDDEADIEMAKTAATFQRSTVTFPFSLLIFGLGTYLLFNAVNRDFDGYYREIGQHVTTLRGDDPVDAEARKEAVIALSLHGRVESLNTLADTLEHDDPETAKYAAWALGRHWQNPHARHLLRPLVGAYRQDRPGVRREALISLARLQHRNFAEPIQQALESQLRGDDVDLRLLWGLGYIQQTSSFDVLEKALHHRDPKVAAVSAWSLAQHRDQRGGREAVNILEARLPAAPFEVKCAIVHGLMILGDEGSNLALIHAWDAMSTEQRFTVCTPLEVYVRPDGADDEQELVSQETYAMKTLEAMGRMRATSPDVRRAVEPWLRDQIHDDDNTLKTREAAGSLLRGIESVRDDVEAAAENAP